MDILVSGRMTLLPPTIHPETEEPYYWIGRPLLEIDVDDLPILTGTKLKQLKAIVGSQYLTALRQGSKTHDAGVGCDPSQRTGLGRISH